MLLGLTIGEYLIFRKTGNVDISIAIFCFTVSLFLVIFISFCVAINQSNSQHINMKTVLDIFAALCLLIFFLSPWWLYLTTLDEPPNFKYGKIPFPLLVFMLDGLPFVAGVIWIASRYASKYPQFFRRRIIFGVIFAGIALPLFLMKMSGG